MIGSLLSSAIAVNGIIAKTPAVKAVVIFFILVSLVRVAQMQLS